MTGFDARIVVFDKKGGIFGQNIAKSTVAGRVLEGQWIPDSSGIS